jgi:hypothetical protein
MALRDINDYGKFENFYGSRGESSQGKEPTDKEKLADFLLQQPKPKPQDPFSLGNFGGSGLFRPVK